MNALRHLYRMHRRKLYWKRAGIAFIHVPKAAGTSVSMALYGRFLGHCTAQQVESFDRRLLQTLPSFGIVRNPWDRCVSAYRFAKRSPLDDGVTPEISGAVQSELEEYPTFASFVHDWLRKADVNSKDYVFQQQSPYLFNQADRAMVNHVGKIEMMPATAQWIEASVNRPVSISHLNKSDGNSGYRDWYDDETRSIVSSIYRRDIVNFGYEF